MERILDEDQKINVSFIIEILGRPKEHVAETLGKIVDEMDNEKGVQVIEKTLHEPKILEEKDEKGDVKKVKEGMELFTSFADVEAEFENLNALLGIIFKYMPSNIEINSPETFVFKNDYVSEILTGVILRLHKYDEITKKLTHDNMELAQRLKDIVDKVRESKENKEKGKNSEAADTQSASGKNSEAESQKKSS
tara:strand:- start:1783 stop:2364 length:582 start_codon:yes stop_codon:yes gene_type:complete